MKTLLYFSFIINVILGSYLFFKVNQHRFQFENPYMVTFQYKSQKDVLTCRKDPNCMDIDTFKDSEEQQEANEELKQE